MRNANIPKNVVPCNISKRVCQIQGGGKAVQSVVRPCINKLGLKEVERIKL